MALMRSVGVRLRLWSREYERDARGAADATDDIGDAGRRAKVDLDGMAGAMDRAAESSRGLARASSGGFGRRGMGLHGYGIAAIVASITAAAPMLGAMIAGAVVGAAGVGGIVGGILAAKDDPRVREAGKDFADTLKVEWSKAGQAFVAPTVSALGVLENAVVGLDIAGILRPAAAHMDELARGAAGFALEFGQGFGEAMRNAGPFLDELAEQLPDIGDALGDFFAGLSKNQGALEGWAFFLNLVEGTIEGVGAALEGLSDVYRMNTDVLQAQDWYPVAAALVRTRVEAVGYGAALDGVAESATGVASSSFMMADALGDVTGAVDALIDRFDQLNGVELDAREANRQVEQSLDDLRDALDASNGSLDITTQEGRDAESALDAVARAAAEVRQSTWEQTGSIEQANAAYANYIGQLRGILIEAGVAEGAVDELIGRIAAMPTYKGIQIQFTITAQTPIGQSNYWALYGEQLARRAIAGFRHGGIVEHAANGLLSQSRMFPAGPTMYAFAEPETGGEAFVAKNAERSRSLAILSQAAGWHGADVVPRGSAWGGGGSTAVDVRVSLAPGVDGPIGQAIEDRLRFQVTQSGGGSVQQHYGRRGKFG